MRFAGSEEVLPNQSYLFFHAKTIFLILHLPFSFLNYCYPFIVCLNFEVQFRTKISDKGPFYMS